MIKEVRVEKREPRKGQDGEYFGKKEGMGKGFRN
jgi:hypothetical protein